MSSMEELIDQYLKGTIDDKNKKRLEQEMNENPAFKQQFEETAIINNAIQASIEEDFRKRFRELDKKKEEKESPNEKFGFNKYWIFAAIVAATLVIGFAILKKVSDINPQQIAQTYTLYDPLDSNRDINPTDKSIDINKEYYSHLETANRFFQTKEYEKSREALQLITLENSVTNENKEWMIGLSYYLESGRKSNQFQEILDRILLNPEHNCYIKAVNLDSEVNSFWGRLKD